MAAQYEKRVLTMDAWGQKQGYPPFCEVVTQEDGLANLQLIVDKVRGKEVPRVPAVSAFFFRVLRGHDDRRGGEGRLPRAPS